MIKNINKLKNMSSVYDILLNPKIRSWIQRGEFFENLQINSRKKNGEKYKEQEKLWGHEVLKEHFDYQKTTNQWTTTLGENLVKIMLEAKLGEGRVWRPKIKNGFHPDWETESCLYEVKSRNYTTTGTAGEKILGSPIKYIDVPKIYGKPLNIVLLGYQEYEAKEYFKLFDYENMTNEKKQLLNMLKMFKIEYIRGSSLLYPENYYRENQKNIDNNVMVNSNIDSKVNIL